MIRLLTAILVGLLAALAPAMAQTVATATAVESSHIICAAPCQIYGGQINNTNASARWVLLFDAVTAPADGAITGCATAASARPCVLKWYQIGASSTIGVADFLMLNGADRLPTKTGLVAVCSSTGPFTKTAAADCTFSFEMQPQ